MSPRRAGKIKTQRWKEEGEGTGGGRERSGEEKVGGRERLRQR